MMEPCFTKSRFQWDTKRNFTPQRWIPNYSHPWNTFPGWCPAGCHIQPGKTIPAAGDGGDKALPVHRVSASGRDASRVCSPQNFSFPRPSTPVA